MIGQDIILYAMLAIILTIPMIAIGWAIHSISQRLESKSKD